MIIEIFATSFFLHKWFYKENKVIKCNKKEKTRKRHMSFVRKQQFIVYIDTEIM